MGRAVRLQRRRHHKRQLRHWQCDRHWRPSRRPDRKQLQRHNHRQLRHWTVSGDDYVGGLFGYSGGGTISASYATGSVTGTGDRVGGLIGNSSSGTITASYATGTVSGDDYVGGLFGYSGGGTISASYATGSVTGTGDRVGGLIGNNFNATVSVSYWDTQTTANPAAMVALGKQRLNCSRPQGIAAYSRLGTWTWMTTGQTTTPGTSEPHPISCSQIPEPQPRGPARLKTNDDQTTLISPFDAKDGPISRVC